MSKFTRDQLKDLVKECLVEILSEGLAPSSAQSMRSENMDHLVRENAAPRSPAPPRRPHLPPRSHSPALNSTVFGPAQTKKSAAPAPTSQPRHSHIAESVGQITSDPILSQILADTATTTLREQIEAESSRPGMPSLEESVGSPMELFEGAQHWATLAFSDNGNRGQKLKS